MRSARWAGRLLWRRLAWLPAAVVLAAAALVIVSVWRGDRFLVVEGGSMRPSLRPGDLLVVRPCEARVLRPGDVVTYQPRPRSVSVTHRVVDVGNDDRGLRLTTKGDANRQADHLAVRDAHVRGRVVAVAPRVGTAARWLKTPLGFWVGVMLPALSLAVGDARRIFRGLRLRADR